MSKKQSVDKARKAAVEALVQIHKGVFSSSAIEVFDKKDLSSRDSAFAGALFFGTAERIATMDFLLAPFLKKGKLDKEVRAILECGLYQILCMRVPTSAAVNESVNLTRAMGKSSAAGLVNAVLRKAAQKVEKYSKNVQPGKESLAENENDSLKLNLWLEELSFADEIQRVCVVYSVSEAVAKAVMQALPNEYDDYFKACFSQGELCLRANSLRVERDELISQMKNSGIAARAGEWPHTIRAFIPGKVAQEPLFLQGMYHVQGLASQCACLCLDAKKGDRVLDMCAAPGGKSASIAQDMQGGLGLYSCDLHPGRLKLIRENLDRLGLSDVQTEVNDATIYREEFCGHDKVLCDVPCSGLGVLAQKPDLRYINGESFSALPQLQLEILETSAKYLKKGGRLVYSTCTVRKEENEEVVKAFLSKNKDEFTLIDPIAVPKGAVVRDKMMHLWPHHTKTDGFFVATMECL